MAADNIQIGKFTLESLTTGMYSEPEACYREYIQNAVDSFDEAIATSLISGRRRPTMNHTGNMRGKSKQTGDVFASPVFTTRLFQLTTDRS